VLCLTNRSRRRQSCLRVWIWIALSLFVASRHRDVSGALLRSPPIMRTRPSLPHERSESGRLSAASCVWFRRCHRLAYCTSAKLSLRCVRDDANCSGSRGRVICLELGMSFRAPVAVDQKAYCDHRGTNILSYIRCLEVPSKLCARRDGNGHVDPFRFFVLHGSSTGSLLLCSIHVSCSAELDRGRSRRAQA